MIYRMKRTVTVEECHWLRYDMKEDSLVYSFNDHTYGCIGPTGVACSMSPNDGPFFELPEDSLTGLLDGLDENRKN
jgi:hypothetical protein